MSTNVDRLVCITNELTEEIGCLEVRAEQLERELSEILEKTRYCKTMLGKARELLSEVQDEEAQAWESSSKKSPTSKDRSG